MSTNAERLDVLVVGAGPVGLSTAIGLMQHGLSVRVVDMASEVPPWSKAQIVHARTLEIFERFGVLEKVLAHGRTLHGVSVYATPEMRRLAHAPIEGIDSEHGYFLSISQRDTEAILGERLVLLGGWIERPVRLESLTQNDESVTASLSYADGSVETLEASWVIGCDGAHSTVRHAMSLAFQGTTYEQRIIQADVHVDMPLHADDEITTFIGHDGLIALFPLVGERRYRFLVPLLDGSDPAPTLETFQAIAEKFGPPGIQLRDPAWMVAFKIHCRMVGKYRVGRAFLAGDAAHIQSPMGAQGMNTGVQDAHNLAWKLALVHKGLAHDVLLDSYDAERRPVAEHSLAITDRATRGGASLVTLRSPIALEARNRLMAFVSGLGGISSQVVQNASMLKIGYPDSPVCGQQRPSLARATVLSRDAAEGPSVRDWVDFGNGPAPGFRAPDVRVDPLREDSVRLFDLTLGVHHTLLLFDGAAHTEEGYRNLDRIAEFAAARLGDRLRIVVILSTEARPAVLKFRGDVLFDAQSQIHQRYGARSECLYLVRPDGHVAFRSQPASLDALLAFLQKVFV